MTELKPGSFGLSIIAGKTGRLVAAGQALTGDGSRFTHAFLVLDKGEIIEAMPRGAQVVPFGLRADDEGGVVFCDPVENYIRKGLLGRENEDEMRAYIIRIARTLEGTPYSFLDYLALTLAHFGIRAERLRKFMLNKGHMICSQLCDEVYRRAGIHLFDDGRLPMDVTPGDLDYYRISNL